MVLISHRSASLGRNYHPDPTLFRDNTDIPNGAKRFTGLASYFSDHYRNAFDHYRFVISKSKDPEEAKRATQGVERLANLSERLLFAMLEAAREKGDDSLMTESLHRLKNLVSLSERDALVESLKKDPEHADKIGVLLPKRYDKKKLIAKYGKKQPAGQ